MRTLLLTALCILSVSAAQSQDRYICRNGHIWFYGLTPLEVIEAHNHEAAGVITPSTGDVAFQVLIKAFKFERALMEQHFNENYMESTKYPKADFKGTITNLKDVDFEHDGKYKTVVEGSLTIHNVTKKIKQSGTIEVKDGRLIAASKFKVTPEDYGIEIPGVVRDKIARQMDVTVEMTCDPLKK